MREAWRILDRSETVASGVADEEDADPDDAQDRAAEGERGVAAAGVAVVPRRGEAEQDRDEGAGEDREAGVDRQEIEDDEGGDAASRIADQEGVAHQQEEHEGAGAMRSVRGVDEDAVLRRRQEEQGDRDVGPGEGAGEPLSQGEREARGDDDIGEDVERVGSGVPVREAREQPGSEEGEALAMGAVLIPEEIPGARIVEEGFVELDLVVEEEVDGVEVDHLEQAESEADRHAGEQDRDPERSQLLERGGLQHDEGHSGGRGRRTSSRVRRSRRSPALANRDSVSR